MSKARLKRIQQKIQNILDHVPMEEIPGAEQHQFEFGAVTDEELLELESQQGIVFPGPYRSFLTRFGWGVGPNEGLYHPKEAVEGFLNDSAKLSEPVDLKTPFTVLAREAEFICRANAEDPGSEAGFRELPYPAPGALPLSHHDGRPCDVLIVSGELEGQVWSVSPEDGTWIPAGETETLSFLDWYERWLDAYQPVFENSSDYDELAETEVSSRKGKRSKRKKPDWKQFEE